MECLKVSKENGRKDAKEKRDCLSGLLSNEKKMSTMQGLCVGQGTGRELQ